MSGGSVVVGEGGCSAEAGWQGGGDDLMVRQSKRDTPHSQ